MDYQQLKKGVAYHKSKYPPNNDSWSYKNLRAKGDDYWLHLERLHKSTIKTDVIDGFLQKWKTQIRHPDIVAESIAKAVSLLPDYYAGLKGIRLEDVNFQSRVTLKRKDGISEEQITTIIGSIHSFFVQQPEIGSTITSKLIHMALPDLFVMLDRGIIDKYCVPRSYLPVIKKKRKSYVAFLILMQENINHAINCYASPSPLTKEKAISAIQKNHGNLPLTRLIDMANFAVRDCEQAVCMECMRKAKQRWHTELGLNYKWEDDSQE